MTGKGQQNSDVETGENAMILEIVRIRGPMDRLRASFKSSYTPTNFLEYSYYAPGHGGRSVSL